MAVWCSSVVLHMGLYGGGGLIEQFDPLVGGGWLCVRFALSFGGDRALASGGPPDGGDEDGGRGESRAVYGDGFEGDLVKAEIRGLGMVSGSPL